MTPSSLDVFLGSLEGRRRNGIASSGGGRRRSVIVRAGTYRSVPVSIPANPKDHCKPYPDQVRDDEPDEPTRLFHQQGDRENNDENGPGYSHDQQLSWGRLL